MTNQGYAQLLGMSNFNLVAKALPSGATVVGTEQYGGFVDNTAVVQSMIAAGGGPYIKTDWHHVAYYENTSGNLRDTWRALFGIDSPSNGVTTYHCGNDYPYWLYYYQSGNGNSKKSIWTVGLGY